jgi:arylsulfatase A-like enzyme
MGEFRSLVLITVDCLRADHVGFMGYPRPTTPFLDSLAANSTVLNNAIVAGAPTYYSFPAIMASRYPLALGRDVIGLAPSEPTIASTLNQIGYDTAAFVAGNPYLSKRFGYAEGFNVFHDFLDRAAKSDVADQRIGSDHCSRLNHLLKQASYTLGCRSLYDELYFRYGQKVAARSPKPLEQLRRFPSADVIVGHASEWLKQTYGRPFFLWLHLMDPHGPYYPPQDALTLMEEELSPTRALYLNSYWSRDGLAAGSFQRYREEIISLYDSGIRWMDQQVARLVDVLRDLMLWNDCLFVLTADHGEEFLEHQGRMHAPPKVTEELVHVPLLLHIPGADSRRVDAPFSLLHLGPTVLDCLRAPAPAHFRGRSYWPQLKADQTWDGDAVVECVAGCSNPIRKQDRQGARFLAVREARYKLVLDFASLSDQLFDLEADPGESNPLSREVAKPVRRRLLERARRHIAESLQSRDTGLRLPLLLQHLAYQCRQGA